MLTTEHRKMLEVNSAISSSVIEARGYKSVKADDEDLRPWAPSQRQDGLLIPSYDIFRKKSPGQLRPDSPRIVNGSTLKYESPRGSGPFLDVHPFIWDDIRNTDRPFVVTEGVKKADCLISHGVPCVALLGVWSWKGKRPNLGSSAMPDWDALPMDGRRILVAFDDDVMEKAPVRMAVKRLSQFLSRHGAKVAVLDWKRLKAERSIGGDA